jgi:hypothetical protein
LSPALDPADAPSGRTLGIDMVIAFLCDGRTEGFENAIAIGL